ncbi:hypothetical protein [Phycicoccus sp. 3266]|uniref:hypothetical protein n=1 Tax=Phycicoccus sp. 3266 TaxID=2817751 RepID=UPI0028583638|nr:hypothetical protein [Phycicoccus sp. 3266]MDR6862174.1 hypothetical protein [Phycicoccus sp. 3266]
MTATAPKTLHMAFAPLPKSATIVVAPEAGLAIAADWLTWEQALACLAKMLDGRNGAWCVSPPLSVLSARECAESAQGLVSGL